MPGDEDFDVPYYIPQNERERRLVMVGHLAGVRFGPRWLTWQNLLIFTLGSALGFTTGALIL